MIQQQLHTPAHWKGSEKTADAVRQEIANRWGEEEAEQYNPRTNCFTLPTWNSLGYRVKKGERAIRSHTYIEATDQDGEDDHTVPDTEDTQTVQRYPKPVYLFYRLQVEKQ